MPCQYQGEDICECPGGPDFEPKKGVIPEENGLRCLDFNKLIPFPHSLAHRKLPGGRQVVDAVESVERLEKAQKKYRKSDKGKDTRKRYRDSVKGKKSAERHQKSPKFKLARQKYQETAKGQKSLEDQNVRKKLWRKAAKWMQDNPGKTFDDYMKEVENE